MSKWKALIKQFIGFGLVGLTNTAISFAFYYGLLYLHVNYIIANCIAFFVSVLNAYYWNNKYVFKKTSKGHIITILKTYVSYGGTFILSSLLLILMVEVLSVSQYLAPILNLFITIPLNFIVNKFWTFK